jgi:PKD repeat protein
MELATPVARFAVNPIVPSARETIEVVDCSHDPGEVGIAWRAWDFGDGSTAVGATPVHQYAAAGEYRLELTLATFDGRIGRETRSIRVRD